MPSRSGSIIALVLLLAGCGGGGGSSPTPVATTTPTPAPAPTPVPTPTPTPTPTVSAKPVLRGLVTMGHGSQQPLVLPTNNFEELNAHPGVYSAAVVNLFWSQLEPAQGSFDDTALDAALTGLAAYNAKYPATPVVAKLRIFMGAGTPAWVIQSTGSVTFTDDSGNVLQVGKFWTAQYQGFWREFQAHLASRYDANSAVAEVAITSCSTLTGEPFIIPQAASGKAALKAAGYTDTLGMACLSSAAADYAAWTRTPLDYTFNAFFAFDNGAGTENTAFTIQVMDAFRASLGTRGVVANHGLQTTLKTNADPIYAEFTNLYSQAIAKTPPAVSPLEFQTFSPTVDWPGSVALALTFHPSEIEVWNTTAAGGGAPLSQDQLAAWALALK